MIQHVDPAAVGGDGRVANSCQGCGHEERVAPFLFDPSWRCPLCVRAPSGELARSYLGQIHCEGAPGHGPITVARAREQDRREVYAKPDGGTEVVMRPRHRTYFT